MGNKCKSKCFFGKLQTDSYITIYLLSKWWTKTGVIKLELECNNFNNYTFAFVIASWFCTRTFTQKTGFVSHIRYTNNSHGLESSIFVLLYWQRQIIIYYFFFISPVGSTAYKKKCKGNSRWVVVRGTVSR